MAVCKVEERVANPTFRWYFGKEELERSPSRNHGVDFDKEMSYRQMTATMIQDMGRRLKLTQLCTATAIVYMHRFFIVHSFRSVNRFNVAAAALFLAAKVEEQPQKLEYVARVFHSFIDRDNPHIDPASEKFTKLIEDITLHELLILQTLGFDLAVEQPHPHVVKCTQLVRASKDLSQTAYIMAQNSLVLTTFCLEHRPAVVACCCINLACVWKGIEIPPSQDQKKWWEYIDPSVNQELLDSLTTEFLEIYSKCPSKLKRTIGDEIKGMQKQSKVKQGESSSLYSHSSAKPPPPHSGQLSKPPPPHKGQPFPHTKPKLPLLPPQEGQFSANSKPPPLPPHGGQPFAKSKPVPPPRGQQPLPFANFKAPPPQVGQSSAKSKLPPPPPQSGQPSPYAKPKPVPPGGQPVPSRGVKRHQSPVPHQLNNKLPRHHEHGHRNEDRSSKSHLPPPPPASHHSSSHKHSHPAMPVPGKDRQSGHSNKEVTARDVNNNRSSSSQHNSSSFLWVPVPGSSKDRQGKDLASSGNSSQSLSSSNLIDSSGLKVHGMNHHHHRHHLSQPPPPHHQQQQQQQQHSRNALKRVSSSGSSHENSVRKKPRLESQPPLPSMSFEEEAPPPPPPPPPQSQLHHLSYPSLTISNDHPRPPPHY